MRRVELDAVVAATPAETVFENVVRFERYPDLAPHVQSAKVHQSLPEPTGRSSWELHFRSGLLRWSETESFDREALRIVFEQDAGDFDSFTGTWSITRQGADTAVRFEADFDFGIPSLEGILDPIAERVIRETVAWALVGLFEHVDFAGTVELAPAAGGS
ncbi:MAG TPA: SRPBCC family protein [Actinocrinis sp.]|uniref:type II toxin-antitoxin system RatA family toxin n=1 Tax=Actinocrinis sp. TaxID=1920516 RepID=UPI002DDD0CA0|nr:SRPBCC family protein [Actinocrinis sp.]HEV2343182.1 SRPBCC family protein [Actinocrinis sp.]